MICPKDGKDCACNVIIGRTICDPPERSGDEFAAMARDAERWRKFCSLDADVYVNTTGWSFVGKGFGEMLARHLDLMAERNKEKS